ncbi:MAG TPA: translation elongation factor Ts [Deltaproteobacteria bacterium]|nr:translation elongation factor Ts [Deltaproteobacteria bacterium]HOM29576.1 translation elongation factor Ts [Deltaproteobacteria bacterium]
MQITSEAVKKLRDKTGVGMMDCKKALEETGGDFDKAVEILRKKGIEVASKRSGRTASQGAVASYIHMGGKIGVLVEVNCESDFVAKSEQFNAFVKDIAMQIAAASPDWVTREEVPAEALEKEREILREQALKTGKPANVVEKIVEGKLSKFYSERCLLDQPFVKDQGKTVRQLLDELMAKTGEKCVVRRFVRFQLGEEI